CAELREWDDDQARELSANLRPLEEAAIERLKTWLPKLSHPVRIGEHDQTAFGLGLMLDYARVTKNGSFAKLVTDSAKKFFLADEQRTAALAAAAEAHRRAGLAAVTGEHYEGGHWLGSFAAYLTTQRGIQSAKTPNSQQPKNTSGSAAP